MSLPDKIKLKLMRPEDLKPHEEAARPMGINYPISSLGEGTDLPEKMLSSRRRRTIEAPSFYHGRLYREPVVVFE